MRKKLISAMICLFLSACVNSAPAKQAISTDSSIAKCFIIEEDRVLFSGPISSYELDENGIMTIIFSDGEIVTTNKENVFIYGEE